VVPTVPRVFSTWQVSYTNPLPRQGRAPLNRLARFLIYYDRLRA
jgi:hypothetical protein